MTRTVAVERRAPAVRALQAAVDQLAGEVSASRLAQLRMVVSMWDRALARWPEGRRRPPSRAVRGMFDRQALEVFWALAVAGELRGGGPGAGPLPVATQRIVRDCLGILADAVVPGQAVALPVVGWPEPKATVGRWQVEQLYHLLGAEASGVPVRRGPIQLSRQDRVRLLAMVLVVVDTGARSSELAAMRMEDLGEGMRTLLVRRQAQNAAHLPAAEEVCVLRSATVAGLQEWVKVREHLVSRVQGDKSALWVSLLPNRGQATAGLPLRPQGVRRAYARGMRALNFLMAGAEGWEPLPTTLEQLRRAVEPAVQG